MANTSKVKFVYQAGYAQGKKHLLEPRLIKVLDIVRKEKTRTIHKLLDVGCGDGTFTLRLNKVLRAKELYGVDISKEAVRKLNARKIKSYSLDIDDSNLPFASNSFDFIFCGNLVELVANADHLLKELHRTLKRNGIIIVTFPNIASWLSRISLGLGYLPYYSRLSTRYDLGKMFSKTKKGQSTGFIRLFTLRAFVELASLYGLKIKKVHGAEESALPAPFNLVDKILSKKPSFAFQIICVLTKT